MKYQTKKELFEAVKYFIENHEIFVGYPNEIMKEVGKNKKIYINQVEVKIKYLGNAIFMFYELNKGFETKYASLTKKLQKQFLSMVREGNLQSSPNYPHTNREE